MGAINIFIHPSLMHVPDLVLLCLRTHQEGAAQLLLGKAEHSSLRVRIKFLRLGRFGFVVLF